MQDVAQAVQRAGLQEMEKRLIRNLSKGYRQRVGIAAALLGSPKVIILDEPTVGLDPAQMIEIRNLIHDLGETHTVILSSHILSEVQTICDRVLIIAHGKVAAQGTPEELAAQLAARGMIAATALGTKEQILAAAAKVEGLTDLRVTAEKGDEVSFTATSTAGADLRAALSKALAEAGCPVVSLTSDTMSLEDIFLQITETAPEEAQPEETEEPAPEAAAAQPEQSAEPAEPQAPADDTPEQPEAENDQRRKSEPCLPFLSGNCAAISPAWSAMLSLVLCWRLSGYITPPTAWCMARRIFNRFVFYHAGHAVLLPALTMRSFADERRNKTDQLLLTSPVGIPSIVMGKYFAQLAVFAVPMAAAAIMPLVLTAFGTISLTSAYATWLAYF